MVGIKLGTASASSDFDDESPAKVTARTQWQNSLKQVSIGDPARSPTNVGISTELILESCMVDSRMQGMHEAGEISKRQQQAAIVQSQQHSDDR